MLAKDGQELLDHPSLARGMPSAVGCWMQRTGVVVDKAAVERVAGLKHPCKTAIWTCAKQAVDYCVGHILVRLTSTAA